MNETTYNISNMVTGGRGVRYSAVSGLPKGTLLNRRTGMIHFNADQCDGLIFTVLRDIRR